VIIALSPAVGAAICFFGLRALLLILICIISCLLGEWLLTKIRKKPSTINDLSAVVTGLLLALLLPPTTTWYAAILGSLFSIIVGKQLFGGLGFNIFNPALLGRAFLMAAYPMMLNTYIKPLTADAVTTATPLTLIKYSQELTSAKSLFIGNVAGSLGETSAVCLIIGGIYLLLKKVGDWRIPLSIFLTVLISATICFFLDPSKGSPFFHLFSGGMLLGVFFMATDPVSTPTTKKGRFVFGVICGLMIMIIRYWGGYPEGVMYSILFMNAFSPLINRYTVAKSFGRDKVSLKAAV